MGHDHAGPTRCHRIVAPLPFLTHPDTGSADPPDTRLHRLSEPRIGFRKFVSRGPREALECVSHGAHPRSQRLPDPRSEGHPLEAGQRDRAPTQLPSWVGGCSSATQQYRSCDSQRCHLLQHHHHRAEKDMVDDLERSFHAPLTYSTTMVDRSFQSPIRHATGDPHSNGCEVSVT